MSRVAELEARRQALLMRSTALRARLVTHGDELEESLTRVDRGISMFRSVTAQPWMLAAGAGLLFMLGPRKALSWVSRGLFLTSIARRAYGLFAARREAHATRHALERESFDPQGVYRPWS